MNDSSLKLKVIGLGGLGGEFLLANQERLEIFHGADLVLIDDNIQKIPVGIGGNVSKIIIESGLNDVKTYSQITEELKGYDLVYVVAGIGGVVGSKISVLIGEIARNFSMPTYGIFVAPFSFEGNTKKNSEILTKTKEKYPGAIFLENDEILNASDKKELLKDAFARRNKEIGDLIGTNISFSLEILNRKNYDNKKRIEYSDLVDKKDFFKKESVYAGIALLCLFFYFVYSSQKSTIKDLSSVINQNIKELPKNIENTLDSCSKNSEIIKKTDIHDCLVQNKFDYFKVKVSEENTFLIKY